MENRRQRRLTFALLLVTCLAASLFSVVYPIYVIRPFRYQGAQELSLALAVSRLRPAITIVCALTAILALVGCWRAQPLKWRRAVAAAGAALAIALVVAGRVNVYELMFHPDRHPSFSAAREVKLDERDRHAGGLLNFSGRFQEQTFRPRQRRRLNRVDCYS